MFTHKYPYSTQVRNEHEDFWKEVMKAGSAGQVHLRSNDACCCTSSINAATCCTPTRHGNVVKKAQQWSECCTAGGFWEVAPKY